MNENDKNSGETPAELQEFIRRYREIQRENRRLKEEKKELQAKIAEYFGKQNGTEAIDLGDERVKVRCRRKMRVEYDEDVLRKRLRERYRSILSPDIKKIKSALPSLRSFMEPVLDEIGSPDPEKVKHAVQSGLVEKEEFAGAFRKEVKNQVAVMQVKSSREMQ